MAKKPPAAAIERPSIYKISISLYQTDIDKLDQVKAHMSKFGVRNLSDSECLRLAVRCVEISEAMFTTYQEMRSEDRRRKS